MTSKPKRRKPKNPVWWRETNENEATMVARTYIEAQTDVLTVIIRETSGTEQPTPPTKEMLEDLIDHTRSRLTDSLGWLETNSPPPLHAALYATRAHGLEVVQAAITGLAWIELAALNLEAEDMSVAQIFSEVEALPDGNLENFKLAIRAAMTRGSKTSHIHAGSSGIITTTLDVWIKKLIGKGLTDFYEPTEFVIGTSQVLGFQNSFLTSKTERLNRDLQIRTGSKTQLLRARSWLGMPDGFDVPDSAELLEEMQQTLIKYKVQAEAASLLKTHLYLVDKARMTGGPNPVMTIHLEELLEAKGYKRRQDEGFQAKTFREEYTRLATLTACWLEVGRVTEKKGRKTETYIDETPYWHIEARRRLTEGDTMGGQQALLITSPDLPIVKTVLIRPGLWWGMSDIGKKYLSMPRELLALPTDGQGNKTERIAVQIAATLAIWVRSSQQQHAGGTVRYKVSKLFEAAGVLSPEDYKTIDRKELARLRSYLAGAQDDREPQGAISILGRVNAFNINIDNDDEFWASGRGWQDRFWTSYLRVHVPDLEIQKPPKTTRK